MSRSRLGVTTVRTHDARRADRGRTFTRAAAGLLASLLVTGRAAADLEPNPDLALEGPGLRLAAGGAGLDAAPDGRALAPAAPRGTIHLEIHGPVVRAMLYWAGAGRANAAPEIWFAGEAVRPERVTAEPAPPPDPAAVGFRADVTKLVQNAYTNMGPGVFEFDVEDPGLDEALDVMYGAGLLVAYTDPSDELIYRILVFDGVDYAYGSAKDAANRRTEAITFAHDRAEEEREVELTLMCGGARPERADRIEISGTLGVRDRLGSLDGPHWQTDVLPLTLPAAIDTTTVELVSPAPGPGPASLDAPGPDTLTWAVGALWFAAGQPWTGMIGDRVWIDTNTDGCQDPGEPGLPDVLLRLYRVEDDESFRLFAEQRTGSDGGYRFHGLPIGAYRLEINQAAPLLNYLETVPDACGDDTRDSDVRNGVISFSLPESRIANPTLDAGYLLVQSERQHPGWNWLDNEITLTSNEPTYWSALTGLPKGVSSWTVLDAEVPPGRPDPDGTGERVLRGYIVAWAIDAVSGREVRWNHLAGDVTVVRYDHASAWQYNAYAFQVVDPSVEHGDPSGTPGVLNLDGAEYSSGYSHLLFNFQAVGATAYSPNARGTSDVDLTLLPISADFRQETNGPWATSVQYDIWNANEVKFSGLNRCITCWDDTLLSNYGLPNHFLVENLHTDNGKVRIDGLESPHCPGSVPVSLLGVASKLLTFDDAGPLILAGANLFGMGVENGEILYDVAGPPPGNPATYDRTDSTQKGSLLFFPKIEVRWDPAGAVVQDTIIHLSNDYPGDVRVKLFFINGDPPLAPGR